MLCDTVNGVWTLCYIVNGAMNTPRYWQLHNDACSHVRTSVNTLVASEWGNSVQTKKKPAQMPPILRRDEFHSRVGKALLNCQHLYEGGAESLKGSHRMLDFLKTLAPLSLLKAFWMNLISVEPISLDSTFKLHNVAINREPNLKRQKLKFFSDSISEFLEIKS